MVTTIKLMNETKNRLDSLDIAGKNKTYDMLVNDLLTYYETKNKEYEKDYSDWKKNQETWKKQNKDYVKIQKKYEEEKEQWLRLLKWAKKQGFKG